MKDADSHAWRQEAVVLAIASALLDRLDRGPKERVRVPRLRLDAESVPGLFTGSARDCDYQWALIESMAQAGWIGIVTDKGRPGEPGYYRNPSADLADEQSLRELTGRRAGDGPTWHERFLEALTARIGVGHPALEAVARFPLRLQGHEPQLVADRLLELRALADEPLLLREVSSRLFFAQSKVLDGKEALVAAILELPECPFPDMPLHLAVQLPEEPYSGVLFIENLTAFDSLTYRGPVSVAGLALVYASGYRCSARRLRIPGGAKLFFAASALPSRSKAESFSAWLLREREELLVYFYGDLDFAGMSILARLRGSFESASAWRPGYQALLGILESGGGHLPEAAGKGGQKDPGVTGCNYADEILLPAIRRIGRFVDQEFGVTTGR